jgi:hypothetical protein
MGGEMTQTMYAHMNKLIIIIIKSHAKENMGQCKSKN